MMAFSTLLRTPVRTMMFSQQLMRLTTQSVLKNAQVCPAASMITLKNSFLKLDSTVSLNSIRSVKTVPIPAGEKPHDHAKLWVVEKLTTAAMVPIIPLALIMPNKIFDIILAILITAHNFWGLEAIAVDYVRASIFGPVIPKIAIGLVYLLSIATLGGLFYIITHDIGIANSIRQFWAVKHEQKA